jgi:antitoxin ParD1/3/4
MTYHTLSFPPALQAWIDAPDVEDNLRGLVRRDARVPDERAWLRTMIEEGEASGIVDTEPEDVLEEIIAQIPAKDD